MRLVVPVQHHTVSADQVRAVHQTQLAVDLAFNDRAAEEQGHAAITDKGQQLFLIGGLHVEEERRGRFGPDDQVGAVGDLQREPSEPVDGVPPVRGVPFLRLVHVGLHEADPDGVVAGGIPLGGQPPLPIGHDAYQEQRRERCGDPGQGGPARSIGGS